MRNFCTLSDKNYLYKGLTLYENLKDLYPDENFCLYYLCLDEETFNIIDKNIEDSIYAMNLKYMEDYYPELLKAKENPASKYGTQYSQYCWCLCPFLIWRLLDEVILGIDEVMYLDSDLFFYHSPEIIFDYINKSGASVGIHKHRFGNENYVYNPLENTVGEFNVGAIYFKNNEIGKEISVLWKDWLLNPKNEHYEAYGSCGDQKYLDLFIPLFGKENICVFDEQGSGIGQLAAWNCSEYQYLDNNEIIYRGEKQKLMFTHFSHFNSDFDTNSWRSSNAFEWKPENTNDSVMKIYHDYFEATKSAKEKYQI